VPLAPSTLLLHSSTIRQCNNLPRIAVVIYRTLGMSIEDGIAQAAEVGSLQRRRCPDPTDLCLVGSGLPCALLSTVSTFRHRRDRPAMKSRRRRRCHRHPLCLRPRDRSPCMSMLESSCACLQYLLLCFLARVPCNTKQIGGNLCCANKPWDRLK
jgi:hypothetical protein